jgi:hypothetical protein
MAGLRLARPSPQAGEVDCMAVDEKKVQEEQQEEIIDRTAPPGQVIYEAWPSARMRNFLKLKRCRNELVIR